MCPMVVYCLLLSVLYPHYQHCYSILLHYLLGAHKCQWIQTVIRANHILWECCRLHVLYYRDWLQHMVIRGIRIPQLL